MASTIAPDVVPIIPREKNFSAYKPPRKEGNRVFMLVGVVLICLLLGMGFLRSAHNAGASNKLVQVVAAGHDIAPGVRLGFTTLHYTTIPKQYYTPEMLSTSGDAAGRITKTFIPMGEPITTAMLFTDKEAISQDLHANERAITLALSDEALVDHAISAGDRVDVIAVTAKDGNKYTKTICQNARVLMSVPKEEVLAKHSAANGQNKITLAVSPELAEVLTEASEAGKLRLVLRNRLNHSAAGLPGSDLRDLIPAEALGKDAADEVEAKAKADSLPAPPHLPAPPVPPGTQDAVPPPPPDNGDQANPLEWVVEMVSGSHKEKLSVPHQ